jgi:hypothetical protein
MDAFNKLVATMQPKAREIVAHARPLPAQWN